MLKSMKSRLDIKKHSQKISKHSSDLANRPRVLSEWDEEVWNYLVEKVNGSITCSKVEEINEISSKNKVKQLPNEVAVF